MAFNIIVSLETWTSFASMDLVGSGIGDSFRPVRYESRSRCCVTLIGSV
jgi:hypothetical protein